MSAAIELGRVAVANLSEGERMLLASVIALLCDPAMAPMRNRFMDGDLAISMDDGEVTWIDPTEVADAVHTAITHPDFDVTRNGRIPHGRN